MGFQFRLARRCRRADGARGRIVTTRFFHVPGITAVPLTDVAPASMAVITRTDDDRPLVAEFAGAVRSCRRSRSTLVPGATMLEPAGAA